MEHTYTRDRHTRLAHTWQTSITLGYFLDSQRQWSILQVGCILITCFLTGSLIQQRWFADFSDWGPYFRGLVPSKISHLLNINHPPRRPTRRRSQCLGICPSLAKWILDSPMQKSSYFAFRFCLMTTFDYPGPMKDHGRLVGSFLSLSSLGLWSGFFFSIYQKWALTRLQAAVHEKDQTAGMYWNCSSHPQKPP